MVHTFDSTMTGAPVLSGTAGALRAVLKACMVDGFGAGAVATLTVAAGIATASFAGAHPYSVGTIAQFGGATPAGLNGQKRILSTTASAITFDATGIADGTATGTITHKVAAAGWQELFAGSVTNVLCLKPTVVEATGCVLRIDDTGTTSARVVGYESMSDAATGVGPTPLESQVPGGLWWSKSSVANATAREWRLVADERGFYIALNPATGKNRSTAHYVGDIASLKSGDAYGFLVMGDLEYWGSSGLAQIHGTVGYSSRSATGGSFLVRSYTGIGQSVAVQRLGSSHNGATSTLFAGNVGYSFGAYPNGPNNGLLTGVEQIIEAGGIRGSLPGLLHPVQPVTDQFSSGVVVSGTNDMAGRGLMALRVGNQDGLTVSTLGTVFIDMTGPWAR